MKATVSKTICKRCPPGPRYSTAVDAFVRTILRSAKKYGVQVSGTAMQGATSVGFMACCADHSGSEHFSSAQSGLAAMIKAQFSDSHRLAAQAENQRPRKDRRP